MHRYNRHHPQPDRTAYRQSLLGCNNVEILNLYNWLTGLTRLCCAACEALATDPVQLPHTIYAQARACCRLSMQRQSKKDANVLSKMR